MVYIFRSLAAIVTHIQKKNMYYFMNIERNVNLFSFLMKKKMGQQQKKNPKSVYPVRALAMTHNLYCTQNYDFRSSAQEIPIFPMVHQNPQFKMVKIIFHN